MTAAASAVLDQVRDLRRVTEAQLEAAVALDVVRLDALNRERTDRLFALQLVMSEPSDLDDAEKGVIREEAMAIRALELRLARVSRSVLGVVARVAPNRAGAPPVYGRSGQLAGTGA